MIQEGTVLAGKYRVERMLGAGGMGYVVAAVHEQLDQRVAVKLLTPGLCENKDAVLRFLREARAAVRIRSEHVARVLDVDELDDGAPYMVMEFLSGQDLARELDERDRFEPSVAIDYLLQACEAVAEAHSIGVIHRDLKPANLFLTRRADGSPLVKVLDFGISKAISPDATAGQSLTAPQSLLGSPAYMSPEQIRRPKTVDIRTDIWSLGTILYEFLVGVTPFRGDTPLSVLAAVVSDPMPSLIERDPKISPELEAIVAKCLEKNPEGRYQTVAELAQALAPHAPMAALSSVSRISGILRSFLPPQSPASTTLRSATSLPPEDQEPALPEPGEEEAPPGTRDDKHTQTDWGASNSIRGRSRRRTRLAIGSGVAGAVLVVFFLLRSLTRSPNADPAPASAAAGALNPASSPSPPITEQPNPLVLAGRADHTADAGRAPVRPAESAKAKASKPPTSAASKIPADGVATSLPGAKPPPVHPIGDDPLEGRR